MKDQETIQQFIQLRAQGVTFARIAQQLDVAKSTLVLWSREHQHLIQNLRAIEWEEFLDRTLASKQDRLNALAEQLHRLDGELVKRDLAAIPAPTLHSMAERLRRRIEREAGTLQFSADVKISRDDEIREAIQDWKP